MKNNKKDGGYFAIKGFAFQFDKTILEILLKDNEDEEVYFEVNEDLELKNVLFQIKYKETAIYTPSAIKKPICQLLEEYKIYKKETILYAYFLDKTNFSQKLSIDELDKIIGDGKVDNKTHTFTNELKEDFINNFTLEFSESFITQFNQVIQIIQNTFSCIEDIALINYPIIYKFLEQKVTGNSSKDKRKRLCTKKELIELIQAKKKIVFFDAYITFLGRKKYLKLIKNEYFIETTVNNHERIFIIELNKTISVVDLKKVALAIKDRFYRSYSRRKMVTSPAPYIHFQNIESEIIKLLKHELLNDGYSFRDGHPFKGANFHLSSLIEESSPHNNISLKFIDDKTNILEVITKLTRTRKIYNFYITNPLGISSSNEHIYVKIAQPDDIVDLFK